MMYLHVSLIFILIVVNIQSAPSPKTVYQIIEQTSTHPDLQCQYIRKTKLLIPKPKLLEECKDFEKSRTLSRISSPDDVNQAVCLLYFNHFLRLCYYSNNYANIEGLISDNLIENAKTVKSDVCAILRNNTEAVDMLKPGIDAVMDSLKNHCIRICTNLDDEYKSLCTLSALMINTTTKIIAASNSSPQNQIVTTPKTDRVAVSKPNITESHPPSIQEPAKIINDVNPEVHQSLPGNIASAAKAGVDNDTPVHLPINMDTKIDETDKKKETSNVAVVNGNDSSKPKTEKSEVTDLKNINAPNQTSSPESAVPKIPGQPLRTSQGNLKQDTGHTDNVNKPKHPDQKLTNEETPNDEVILNNVANGGVVKIDNQLPEILEGNQPNAVEDQNNKNVEENPINDLEAAGESPSDIELDDDDDEMLEFNKPNEIQPEPSEVKAKPTEKSSKPLETNEDMPGLAANYQNQSIDDSDSYFFSYFMMVCIMFICGYVAYHNKQKILALLVEGRRGRRPSRTRRPNSANYHKLDSNLEEAVTSSCNKNATQVIY